MWRRASNGRQRQETPAATWRPGLFELRERKVRSKFADVDGAQAIAERGGHALRHIAPIVAIAATDVADAEAMTPVVMMIPTTPAAAPSTPPAEAAVGASAIAPREAAATSARVSLRNMVVFLRCAPWRGLIVSVLPIAHQSLRSGARFEKTAFGTSGIF